MGLQKVALNFIVKHGGKLAKSSLCTKPQKAVNSFKGLKYASELKTDTFVKKVESWFDSANHIAPYAEEGTMVKGHHDFNAINSFYNNTLEHDLEYFKGFRTPERIIDDYNYKTEKLLQKNEEFTKLVPQPQDCTAFRGTSRYIGEARQDFDVINGANIGDTIIPTRGYAYGAHHKIGTYQYMGSPYAYTGEVKFEPMMIEYRIPKGAQISSNMEHGGEVVFPALSKFKLLSREIREIEKLNPGGTVIGSYPYKHVILEYIPEIPLLKDIEQFLR